MRAYRDALSLQGLDPWLSQHVQEGIVDPCLAHLESVGLKCMVSDDLRDCRAFWQAHKGGKDLIEFPAFDSEYHGDKGNGLVLFHGDRAVGQVWRRLVPLWDARTWTGSDLEEAINDGSLLYGPAYAAGLSSTVHSQARCNSTLARSIRCSNPLLGGAVWIEKEYRRGHNFSALSRLSRLYAVAMLQPWYDFILLVCRDNPNGGAGNLSFRSFGVTRLEDGCQWDGQRYLIGHSTLEECVKVLIDTAGEPLDEAFAQRFKE